MLEAYICGLISLEYCRWAQGIVYWPDSSSLLMLSFHITTRDKQSTNLLHRTSSPPWWPPKHEWWRPLWYKMCFVPALILFHFYSPFFSLLLSYVWSQGQGCGCRLEITCKELRVFFWWRRAGIISASVVHHLHCYPTFRIRKTCLSNWWHRLILFTLL